MATTSDWMRSQSVTTNSDKIENVDTAFKAGIGDDSKKLIDGVRGQGGIRQSVRSSPR
jgi:hypothetical protein